MVIKKEKIVINLSLTISHAGLSQFVYTVTVHSSSPSSVLNILCGY